MADWPILAPLLACAPTHANTGPANKSADADGKTKFVAEPSGAIICPSVLLLKVTLQVPVILVLSRVARVLLPKIWPSHRSVGLVTLVLYMKDTVPWPLARFWICTKTRFVEFQS